MNSSGKPNCSVLAWEKMSEVSMCDSLIFLQHICRWTSSTLAAAWLAAAMTATYSALVGEERELR
eukprot:scaffold38928_cov69-Phaeocystis_antarctica.AAC.1